MKRIFILAACTALLVACNNEKKDEPKSETTASTEKEKQPPASEFADARYVDMGKKMSSQFTSGDIDGWVSGYADNARFRWSSGDSLDGKAAIAKYWKDRRTNIIDSIQFLDEIWLPIKVNTPQSTHDSPGVWLLHWYTVNVKYKNGKRLVMGIHNDYHYDANDKIDQVIQYMDRAPVNAASANK